MSKIHTFLYIYFCSLRIEIEENKEISMANSVYRLIWEVEASVIVFDLNVFNNQILFGSTYSMTEICRIFIGPCRALITKKQYRVELKHERYQSIQSYKSVSIYLWTKQCEKEAYSNRFFFIL